MDYLVYFNLICNLFVLPEYTYSLANLIQGMGASFAFITEIMLVAQWFSRNWNRYWYSHCGLDLQSCSIKKNGFVPHTDYGKYRLGHGDLSPPFHDQQLLHH